MAEYQHTAQTVTCTLTKGKYTVTCFADNLPEMLRNVAIAWVETDPAKAEFDHQAYMHFFKHIANGDLPEGEREEIEARLKEFA